MCIKRTRMFTATLPAIALKYTNNKLLISENKLTITTCNNMDECDKQHTAGPKKPCTKEYCIIIFIVRSKVNKTKLHCLGVHILRLKLHRYSRLIKI